MTPEIYITGCGICSALGIGKEATWEAISRMRSGIGEMHYLATAHRTLPVGEVPLDEAELRRRLDIPPDEVSTRTELLGRLALLEAVEESGLGPWLQRDNRIALISGTTVGGMDKSEMYFRDFLENDTRNAYIATHDCGACTEMIAAAAGHFDRITTISTACSSAANAILTGSAWLRTGQCEVAVVGGSECITKFHLNGFRTLMILDEKPCRPFDASRAGLNLGEGAAYLVLATGPALEKYGMKPLFRLSGCGNACDAFHQTASSPEGDGAFLAMQEALRESGLQPADIGYINAHGTGTPNNDLSEGLAIERLFGPSSVPPVSSTKAFTGHTTSASGSIEAVLSLMVLEHQQIPVNLRYTRRTEGLSFDAATSPQPPAGIRHVLSNSFGFGGNDTSCIFSKL